MRTEFSAGGVVVRRFRGRPFFAAIITFKGALALPKGHPGPGESAAEAALREVREETGLEASLVDKLDDVRYWYFARGERRHKVVRFFLLRYRSGSIADHDHEVAAAEWVPLEDGERRLAYPGERRIAAQALAVFSR